MGQRLPIYATQDGTYRADSCRPLEIAARAGRIKLESVARGQYPGRRLPNDALHGLRTVGFWDATEQQAWGLDWHQNEGIEICFLERGQLEFAVDGQSFLLRPGDLTITRPWQRHRLGDPQVGAGRLHWVIVDVGVRRPHQRWNWPDWAILTQADLQELTGLLRHNEQPVWSQATGVGGSFLRIAEVMQRASRDDVIDLSWIQVLINELFLQLLDLLRSREFEKDATLTETQRTVELFLEDLRSDRQWLAEEWSLKRMAEACG